MAQDSWPSPAHASRAVNDTEYEKIAARFSDDGVWGDPADTAVCSAGTGLSVNVRSGVYGSVRGHAWTSGTTTVPLTIAANSSGSTRTDRIVLRLDRSAWTVRAVVLQGTPGAGAPAVTQQTGDTGVYEVPLATVTVPNSASSVTVTRGEQYIGARIRPCLSTARPINPKRGEMVWESDTGRWAGWNGSTWVVIFEDTGEVSLSAGFTTWEFAAANVGQLRNGIASVRLSLRRISSTFLASDADGSKLCVVPASMRPNRNEYATGIFTNGALARIEVRSDGEVWAVQLTKDVPAGAILDVTLTYML